jgi:hypothetical protein
MLNLVMLVLSIVVVHDFNQYWARTVAAPVASTQADGEKRAAAKERRKFLQV